MGMVNFNPNYISRRKTPPPFPSSNSSQYQNQPFSIISQPPLLLPLSSSLYNTTTSFSSFEPYLSIPSNYSSSNPSLFPAQESTFLGNNSSMQFYYYGKDQNAVMFGNEGSCTSSDNGSSNNNNNNHIKQEDMGSRSAFQSYNFSNFNGTSTGFEENEKFMLNYGSSSATSTTGCGYLEETSTPLDHHYAVEDVKELISSNNNNSSSSCASNYNYNINGSNSFFFLNDIIDENKTQEKAFMYFY